MMHDPSACSIRSAAFSVYNKVALAERSGHREPCSGHPSGAVKAGSVAEVHSQQPKAGQACSLGFPRQWVGCSAVFPPFKLAQMDLGPSIRPPVIEEGQEPLGWLDACMPKAAAKARARFGLSEAVPRDSLSPAKGCVPSLRS